MNESLWPFREGFALVIRIVGLWLVVRGLMFFVTVFDILTQSFIPTQSSGGSYLRFGLLYFFFGLYFLRGAPLLVNFAYPRHSAPPIPPAAPVVEQPAITNTVVPAAELQPIDDRAEY